jgi:hypothetical protein
MNCKEAGEMLMDLLDGQLDPPSRQSLLAHLAGCQGCAGEYAMLRRARRAMELLAAKEPPMMTLTLPSEPARAAGGAAPVRRLWRPAAAAACLAAACAAAVLLLPHEKTITTAVGMDAPVEITRTGVSLTILSRPPEWDRQGDMPVAQGQQWTQKLNAAGIVGDWSGQINGPGQFTYLQAWPGLALVRDQRVIRNLQRGQAEVRFADVPAGIWPDSVRLRCLDDDPPMKILEQNYQYDLASAAAVLAKHVGKGLTVLFKDGQSVSGTLLSFDGGTLVIQPTGQGPRNIARRELAAVMFAELPQGLLSTPTLLWRLANPARRTQRQFEVAYLTTGLTWRADYVLRLHPAGKAPAGEADPNGADQSAIIDRADLVGYATIVNNSGVTFQDAQLKLMAGDVNLLIRPSPVIKYNRFGRGGDTRNNEPPNQMVEKSFFEYHLYTLMRPTTIADKETKQLEMVSGAGLAMRRGYIYDPAANPTAALVVSEMENTEANGLGKPLPKGVVRLYAPDPEGVQTYVAQTTIDHTPVKEKLRLPWGHAFDIACSWREVDAKHAGTDHHITAECSLRNHKDRPVTVTVIVHVPAGTYQAQCKLPWHVREVGLVEVPVNIPAGAQTKFTFSYKFNNLSGGGLRSPYDQQRSDKPLTEGAQQ